MTAPASATWAATGGSLSRTTGERVTWTAPAAGPSASVTATPGTGTARSVSMTVEEPSHNELTHISDHAYRAGLAGSGFTAAITVHPVNVSFSRIEVREGYAIADVSGFYETMLAGSAEKVHPYGAWYDPTAAGFSDRVGITPPGVAGPFSEGVLTWAIPQFFRVAGDGGLGTRYYTATHEQTMTGPSGDETTSKEGASRNRTP